MRTIHKALKIWKCNISILFSLLVMMLLSFIYSVVVLTLLFLMWPFLFIIGAITLSEEKFNKWIDIYINSIPEIPENKNKKS